jgi:hypothetical protein
MKRSGAITVLAALVIAACGGEERDRFSLRTPSDALDLLAPTATPTPERKPVTRAERRVIRGWADELRRGHVEAAARYFRVPAAVSNDTPGIVLKTARQVEAFNASFPCGARLLQTRRSVDPTFVVAIFRLTERPGPGKCGTGTGKKAAVAFQIRREHIRRWVRADAAIATPTPAPTPPPTIPPDTA